MFKVIICISIFTITSSIIVTDQPPTSDEYKYSYDIQDPTTGDTKSQYESKNGGVVTGSYSVLDPDGTKRTVKYTADTEHGFQAVIHQEVIGDLKAKTQHYAPHQANGYLSYDYSVSGSYEDIGNESRGLNIPLQNPYLDLRPRWQNRAFFTPANEINDEYIDKSPFSHGQYFLPAK